MSEVPSVPASAPAAASTPAATTQATPAAATKEATAPVEQVAEKKVADLKKKYNLKVNGKEQAVELDLNDDASVQKYLQKAMASDEKFQEAATLRKDVQLLVKTLKENPLSILTHPDIGIDIKMLAQQVINQELDDMQKSPEQKRMEELERELNKERGEKQRLTEERHAAEMAKHQEAQMREIDTQITDALKGSTLPKVPYVIKRISDTMVAAFDMGYKDISVKDVMPIVEKQLSEEFGGLFDNSSEDVIEKLLGKNLDRLRKKRIAAKKVGSTSTQVKDTGTAKPKEEKKEDKKQRFEDLFGKF